MANTQQGYGNTHLRMINLSFVVTVFVVVHLSSWHVLKHALGCCALRGTSYFHWRIMLEESSTSRHMDYFDLHSIVHERVE